MVGEDFEISMFYAVFSLLRIDRVVESLIELIYSKFTFVERSKQFFERTRLNTWRDGKELYSMKLEDFAVRTRVFCD